MSKKLDLNVFVERARKVHGDKYDYSQSVYTGMLNKIKIICPEHGEFWQTPVNHLDGKGCPSCGHSMAWDKRGRMNTDKVIDLFKNVHGDKYDYSKVVYTNAHTKVCIICPVHGAFWQTPNNHLYGYGCKKCAMDALESNKPKSTDEFIINARKVHGDKYDYSKVIYVNSHKNIDIICPKHGIFSQLPTNHLKGEGCPFCGESKLEKEIRILLTENNINYIFNKSNKWLKGQRLDFYLPDKKIAIECQGIQHFEPTDFSGKGFDSAVKNFLKVKKLDLLKRKKCFDNGVEIFYYSDIKGENIINDKTKLLEKIIT